VAGVGRQVRRIRREQDMTQTELAREAGMATNTINRIERGHMNPSADSLARVASVLGVPVGELYKNQELVHPKAPAPPSGQRELIFRQAYESAEDFDVVFERALEEARASRAYYLARGMRLSVSDDGQSVALYAVSSEAEAGEE
jgi:transcriptional regulator with XRE-family HTH domain